MLSDIQLEANRANAQKSTGPKTDAGKQRSRLNGIRHGLTGQVVVLPNEDMEAFKLFATEIVDTLKPENAVERQLAQSYASFQWRINRAAAIENTMFSLGIMEEVAENLNIEHAEVHNAVSNAKTFRANAHAFDRLTMYNQRLVNQADKVLKQLKQFQAERGAKYLREIAEASRIYSFHRMQDTTYDPRQNGFELTVEQIQAYICRQNLHSQSRQAAELAFNRVEYLKKFGKAAA